MNNLQKLTKFTKVHLRHSEHTFISENLKVQTLRNFFHDWIHDDFDSTSFERNEFRTVKLEVSRFFSRSYNGYRFQLCCSLVVVKRVSPNSGSVQRAALCMM